MNICDAYSGQCDLVGVAGIVMREQVVLDVFRSMVLGGQHKGVFLSDERENSH